VYGTQDDDMEIKCRCRKGRCNFKQKKDEPIRKDKKERGIDYEL